jgi:hypothetical protein
MLVRSDSGDAESGLFVFGEGDCARKCVEKEIGEQLSVNVPVNRAGRK